MPTKQLLNFRARAKTPLQVRSESATKAEIVLYAGIGQDYWGDGSMVSAKQFSDELKSLPKTVNELTVRINSPGGDVFDGVTIYNRIKQFDGTVNVIIDGLAASIASIIALAGDNISIGEGALYMVHLPWTFAYGNRMELDNIVNRLMDVEDQMLGIYAKKSGLDRSEIKALLENETWMDADQAIEKGFVDAKVGESVPIAASAIRSPWIRKKPENYNSETKAVESAKAELTKKISGILARK
jgi:ATP-dependent Clp protease protease subunit